MTSSGKSLLRALSRDIQSPPPVWLMRQAGRYLPEYRRLRAQAKDFLDLCFTPALAVEVTLQPIRRFGFDAAILFSDILVVPYALGQQVRFVEGEGPRLPPLRSVADLGALSADGVRATSSPLEPVYEAVAGIQDALPENVALIGFAGAPWTVACYMVEGGSSRDFHAVKSWAFGDPDGFARLIDIVVEATVAHLLRQVDAGAEVLQLFDSHAGVLPDGAYERWIVEPTKRVVAGVRTQYPEVPIIGFPRGSGVRYESYAAATGVTALSIDSAVPAAWAAAQLQPRTVVQGNLDPVLLLAGGAAMDAAIDGIIAQLAQGPMIFNLGHGVIKETPPDHVAHLVERVKGAATR